MAVFFKNFSYIISKFFPYNVTSMLKKETHQKTILSFTAGFTLVEILVAISIMLLIATISFFSLKPYIKKERINNEVRVLTSFLQEARSKTLSSKESGQYGIRTETNQIILFKGSSYSVSDPDNVVHNIDPSVYLSIGGGLDTVFKRLTGEVVGITSDRYIILYTADGLLERTVVIHPSGLVENLSD